jgi:hypothetical protein
MTQNNKKDGGKINTISNEVETRANQLNSHASSSSAQHQHVGASQSSQGGNSSRWSFKRKSSRKVKTATASENESIALQEGEDRPPPLQLKASLLRRKIKEYEGNETQTHNKKILHTKHIFI